MYWINIGQMARFCDDGEELLSFITRNLLIIRRTVYEIKNVNCFKQFRIGPYAGFCGSIDDLWVL